MAGSFRVAFAWTLRRVVVSNPIEAGDATPTPLWVAVKGTRSFADRGIFFTPLFHFILLVLVRSECAPKRFTTFQAERWTVFHWKRPIFVRWSAASVLRNSITVKETCSERRDAFSWYMKFTSAAIYTPFTRRWNFVTKFDQIDERRCTKILRREICSCFCDIFLPYRWNISRFIYGYGCLFGIIF